MRFRLGTFLLAALMVVSALSPILLFAQDRTSKQNTGKALTLGQAVILGAVEGLTEYLPVSSTGHLLIAERFMGLEKESASPTEAEQQSKEAADAYAICIQAGAILAVLWLYFGRIRQILDGLLGKDREGLALAINVGAAFLPAAVIGLLFNKAIKAYLFGMWPVIAAWAVGGVAILVVSYLRNGNARQRRSGKSLDQLRVRAALIIGFAQCIAMWPGVSRSLVTIVGGVLVGLSLPAAVEFSFLLGLVTLGAATAYDGLKHGQIMLQTFDGLSLAVGLITAFIFAVISIKWMIGYLNRHSLAIFGYYRVLIALVAVALLFAGIL